MTRGGTRTPQEPPKDCPSWATVEGTGERVTCDRMPDRPKRPWHDGAHRHDMGGTTTMQTTFGPMQEARIAWWVD